MSVALVASMLVHVPLTPLILLLTFFLRVSEVHTTPPDDVVDPPLVAIEFIDEPTREPPPPAGGSIAPESNTQLAAKAPAPAGSRDPSAGKEPAEPAALGDDETGERDSLGSLTPSQDEPAVQIVVWPSSLRAHPLAADLAKVLRCGPFGVALTRAQIDPLEDVDAALFAGPRLFDPSSYATAILHHMPEGRVLLSLTRMLAPKDAFIAPKAARIQIAHAVRIVSVDRGDVLLAVPERSGKKSAQAAARVAIPAARGRALALSLRKSALTATSLGLHLPGTLERLRMEIRASANGTFFVDLELSDENDALARAHVAAVASEVDGALREIAEVSQMARFVAPLVGLAVNPSFSPPEFDFAPAGRVIRGRAVVTPEEARALLASVAPFVCVWPKTGSVAK